MTDTQFQMSIEKLSSNKKVISKKIALCSYCSRPVLVKNLIKCSGKKCNNRICKSCTTFIDDKPFCHECVINFVRNKSLFIITKGGNEI